ncbi:hypothetical protein [Sporomusa silvacetica]|uniref:hypothetical protein n=1 Tax=Sporomusa silvacetica TaxID=55504 RepID=UPI000B99EA14|nr:hypothetical protein [Sporomusa silvacetica]
MKLSLIAGSELPATIRKSVREMKRWEVVLCGNSVYLSGLAASLRRDACLRIVQVDVLLGKALNDLKIIRPDVVVTEGVGAALLDAMVGEIPGMMVIAVDAATDTLTILNNPETVSLPVTNLARIIAECADGTQQVLEVRENM